MAKPVVSGASRRSFLRAVAAAPAVAAATGAVGSAAADPADARQSAARRTARPHVAVVGAGAFGGWTALSLVRSGARVTLIDNWGPGNSRSSSGDETRIIRGMYGPDAAYYPLAARAFALWREAQQQWQRPLFREVGMAWIASDDGAYERSSLPLMEQSGIEVEELAPGEAARRIPAIKFDDRPVFFEPRSGYLLARAACAAVWDAFLAAGGAYRQASVTVQVVDGGLQMRDAAGEPIVADKFVLACGAWLKTLLPESLGPVLAPTKQEAFYFGTPPGDASYGDEKLPAWIDNGPWQYYGIPSNQWRGLKVADDRKGPPVDPAVNDRTSTPEALAKARKFLDERFPGMRGAPLNEARVCTYENSADGHYILDQLPGAANAWVLGGGSGHGFKMGPAIGELAARMVQEGVQADPLFRLNRFQKAAGADG